MGRVALLACVGGLACVVCAFGGFLAIASLCTTICRLPARCEKVLMCFHVVKVHTHIAGKGAHVISPWTG